MWEQCSAGGKVTDQKFGGVIFSKSPLGCRSSPCASDRLVVSTGVHEHDSRLHLVALFAALIWLAAVTEQKYGPLAKQLGGIVDSPEKIAFVNHIANSHRGTKSS